MFGISEEEFLFLTEETQQKLLQENLGGDASALALKGIPPAICRQLKALEKCREKLPHYYDALCIIPPTSLEQASSIYTTQTKAYAGKSLLDLTCGLGGDTSHFATKFDHVTSIERDPLLAKIAQHNFNALNRTNIEVVNSDAQTFLTTYDGAPLDVIYCDPARRDETRRTFLLEDCSPDILSLLDDIRRHTSTLVVKLSPLFDVDEVFRVFSAYGVTVEVVSYDGECKEVIAEIAFAHTHKKVVNTVIAKNGSFQKYTFSTEKRRVETRKPTVHNYIYLADVTFKKCRNTPQLLEVYFNDFAVSTDEHTVLTDAVIPSFPGRGYRIIEAFDYKPKALKKLFKERQIKGATLIKGNTQKSLSELRKALSLEDNSQTTLLIHRDILYLVEPICVQ